jgi:hypothetical protein
MELSFARALVALPSSIPPLGSRVTVQLGKEAEGIAFKGKTAYVQKRTGCLFGIELSGKPEENIDKLKSVLPFCSHPTIDQVCEIPEKRKFYRWNIAIPSHYECENRVTPCSAVDISYGGARLETSEVPPERSELQLTLAGETPQPIKARVVHLPVDTDPFSHRVQFGVEFLANPDEKRRRLVPLLRSGFSSLQRS